MMHCFWLLFSVFIIFLTGNAILRIVDNGKLYGNLIERAAISYGLGIGAVTVIQLYALFIRIPLNKINILLLISPFLIIRIFYALKDGEFKKISELILNCIKRDFLIKDRLISKRTSVLEALLIIYLVVLCLMMFFVCVSMPMYTWDSRAVWGLKAKMFFHNQTIFTGDFLDPHRFHSNTPYPLLIPLAENFFYNMFGSVDDYSVKIIFALFYICLLFLLYATQKKYFSVSRLHSLIFTSVFASLPFLFVIYSGSVPSAYADFPLACFYTFALIYLFNYMQNLNKKDLFLAVFFASCCIFTKNEGMALYLISCAALLIDTVITKRISERKGLQDLAIYALFPLLILVPWFILRSKLPVLNDNNPLLFLNAENLLAGFSHLKVIMKLTVREMFTNFKSWGIAWAIIVIAVILNPGRSSKTYNARTEIYLLGIPIFYYLFVITPIFMFYVPFKSTFEIEFNGTSFERLRLHVLPLLLLFVSLRIKRVFNKEA